jgi:hypothetical protein
MNRRHWLLSASGVTLLGSGCAQMPGGADHAGPGRDPAQWPFASNSPWNTPLGDAARYAPIDSPGFDPRAGATINTRQWSHPVFAARVDDPTVAIYRRGETAPIRVMRVHPQARPDPMDDGALHLIDVPRRHVVELWRAERIGPDRIVAEAVVVNRLDSAGIYADWHGVRAYGGSALGGLIRTGELEHGIPHVLALAVPPLALNRIGPDGKPWVWPASAADDGDGRRYGTRGNLHMGSLLAIPPGVDLDQLGLSAGSEWHLGKALQNYGACITDTVKSARHMVLYGEPNADSAAAAVRSGQLQALVELLQVVINHGPRSVGGGGRRRAPPAPDLDLNAAASNPRP